MIDEKTLPPLDAPAPPHTPPPQYVLPAADSSQQQYHQAPSPHQQQQSNEASYFPPQGPPPQMSQTYQSGSSPGYPHQPYPVAHSPTGSPAPQMPTPGAVQTLQTVNGGTQLSYTGQPGYPQPQQPPPQFPSPAHTPANRDTKNEGGSRNPYPPPPANQPPNAQGQNNTRSPYPASPAGYQQPATSTPPTGASQMVYVQNQGVIGDQFRQELFARCARGDHAIETSYGPCGIITAICLFPIGLICLFMDSEKKCSRCGTILA